MNLRPGRRHTPRYRPRPSPGRRKLPHTAEGRRLPHPRPENERAQKIRPQSRQKSASVLKEIICKNSVGIDDKAVPIFADATKGLPFASGYFDILFTVDAYHYFGDTPEMLPSLIPFVKKGGYIAAAVPGLKYEFGKNVPAELQPFWNSEMERTLHSLEWWQDLWRKAEGIKIVDSREMACCTQAWKEWLTGYNPFAAEDRKMMEAEGGKYFNLVQLIAKVV
jgi:SAM-dependent methyltransferase